MKARTRLLYVGVTATILVAGAAGTANALPARQSAVFKIVGNADAVLLSERSIGHGAWLASWKVGSATVEVAGVPGLTVHVDATEAASASGSVTASATAPRRDKLAAISPRSAYVAGGFLARDEARAVGFSAADTANVVQVHAVTPMLAVGDIYDSWCVNTSGDSGYAWGHGCVVQKILQMNGGDWYIGDEISGTANDTSGFHTGNSLTNFRVRNDYPSGNTVVEYNPTGTVNRYSCSSYTPTLSYNGVGIQASATICADNEQPTFNGNIGYGVKWNGCDGFEEAEGVSSVSVVHDPPTASPSSTLYVTIWWGSWC